MRYFLFVDTCYEVFIKAKDENVAVEAYRNAMRPNVHEEDLQNVKVEEIDRDTALITFSRTYYEEESEHRSVEETLKAFNEKQTSILAFPGDLTIGDWK